ncbi:MAG: hypothetical protein WCJ93_01925 [Methanomicrobiales archaeon]
MHIVVSFEVVGELTWPPLLRAMRFILVTAIVAVISATKDKYQQELVESKKGYRSEPRDPDCLYY